MKFAFYWAASCGGREIAVLDINEKTLDIVELADIVFWPVAIGQIPLRIEIYDHNKKLLKILRR